MPSTYNPNDVARLKHVNALAQLTVGKLAETIKYVSTSGNTVSFFTTADGSGTAAFTFDFPEELFLDQTGTTLVENFAWSAAAYPNSTNPNLEGKTVLVLGVRGDAATPTVKYSFVNLEKLIDTYTAADNSINIAGYSVNVKVSATATNIISVANDGLLAELKLGGASAGNVATFGANGYIQDGGFSFADIDSSNKIDKVTSAVTGNIPTFGADGTLTDSGFTFASDSDVIAMLNETFGAGSISSIT